MHGTVGSRKEFLCHGNKITEYSERGKKVLNFSSMNHQKKCPCLPCLKTVSTCVPPPSSFFTGSSGSSTSSLVSFDHRSPYAFTVTKERKPRPKKTSDNIEQSCYVIMSFLTISMVTLALVLIYLSQTTKVMQEGIADY